MSDEVELVLDCKNILGECILWDEERACLLWTDIDDARLWRLDPATGEGTSRPMPDRVGSFALRRGGGLVLALANGLAFYELENDALTPIADVEATHTATRLNDGRCDRQGRFVVGGFDEIDRHPSAGVYRLDHDLSVHQLIGGVATSNSICFSPDGRTMYFADTPTGIIRAYDYDPDSGVPSKERVFATHDDQPGMPDGSVVDAEGYLWNAQVFGSRLVRYAPDGRIDRVIELPIGAPTCPCFGGPNLDVLYITSLRRNRTEEELARTPEAGGIHALRPGVRGLPEDRFAG